MAGWRVLSGAGASSLAAVAQVARSGFETAIALPPGTSGRYMTVQALDAAGQVIGTALEGVEGGPLAEKGAKKAGGGGAP